MITKVKLNKLFHYAAGEILIKGINFILIPFYTKFLLPQEYGKLNYYIMWINIISVIISLGLNKSVQRYYCEENLDFNSFLKSNLIFNLIIFLIIILLFPLGKYLLIFSTNIWFYIIVISFGGSITQIYLNYLNIKEESFNFTIFNSFQNISIILLNIWLVIKLNKEKYMGIIYSNLIIMSFLTLYIIIFFMKKIKKSKFRLNYIKESIIFGIPLIFHSLGSIVLSQGDRYFIEKYFTYEKVGLYSLAYNIGNISILIMTVLTRLWLPYFYKNIENKSKDVETMATYYSYFISITIVFLFFIINPLYTILFTKNYSNGIAITKLVLISNLYLYLYSIYGNYNYFLKTTAKLCIMTMITAVINILLNILFMKKFGFEFAAYSTIISYFLFFIFNYLYLRKEKRVYIIRFRKVGVIPIVTSLILLIFLYC